MYIDLLDPFCSLIARLPSYRNTPFNLEAIRVVYKSECPEGDTMFSVMFLFIVDWTFVSGRFWELYCHCKYIYIQYFHVPVIYIYIYVELINSTTSTCILHNIFYKMFILGSKDKIDIPRKMSNLGWSGWLVQCHGCWADGSMWSQTEAANAYNISKSPLF